MRTKEIIAATVVSLLLLTGVQAFAFGEIRYTDRPLNLRDGRSPKAKWIGNLYPGQEVRIDHLQDGWVAIYEPSATNGSEAAAIGFSNVKYLKKKRTRYEPRELGELVYTYRALNVRVQPDVKSRKVTTLKAGTHVRIDFPDGEWARVFSQDATIRSHLNGIGYSSVAYFKPATAKSLAKTAKAQKTQTATVADTIPVVTEPDEVTDGQVTVSDNASNNSTTAPLSAPKPKFVTATSLINIHDDRTTGSPLAKTLKPGDTVQVGLTQHGWYAVFAQNELVLVEDRAIGYALQSIVDKGTRTASDQSRELALSVGPASTASTKPTSKASPAPRPEAVAASTPKSSGSGQTTMTIDRSGFTKTKKPDPTPDKTAHGYKYRVLEKSETRQLGESWITLKVFLSTSKKPTRDSIKDFATTLWKENRRVTKNVAVLIYLPGMDVEDLAYGVIKFDDKELLEIWVREATLLGTRFL
nr:SH3 domain-containing protein [uncultured Pseudodesulfovibrio sp.]